MRNHTMNGVGGRAAPRFAPSAMDLIQGAAMLLLLGMGTEGAVLLLPPFAATPLLLIGSGVLLHRLSRRTTRAAWGLHRPTAEGGRWIALAALVTAVLAPALALLNVQLLGTGTDRDPLRGVEAAPWGWLSVGVVSIVVAPLIEELVLRGWLLNRLRRHGAAPALLVTSLLFAVLHVTAWRLPYFFVMGLLFGGAVLATRTVWAGIALHVSYNASLLAIGTQAPRRDHLAHWVETQLGPLAVELTVAAGVLALGLIAWKLRPSGGHPPSPHLPVLTGGPRRWDRLTGRHPGR